MREFLNSFQKLEFDKVKKYIQRYAISDLGREHLDKLIPSFDINEILDNLILVTEMKLLLETDDPLPLDNISDIRISLHRSAIENYILSSEELHKIELVLITSRIIHTYFARRTKLYPLLSTRVKSIYIEKLLEYNIHQAIDEDGKVKDSASKELQSIRRQIIDKSHTIRRNLESVLKSIAGSDWAQEEIITTREGRMVIPVKTEYKNRVPGFIHSASASGATVYIEPAETLEVNNEIRTLYFQEQREIEKILKELTRQVREVKDNLLHNIQVLAELDFVQAKAKYSIEMIGTQPVMKSNGEIRLVNAYHPLLLQKHGRRDVVSLNLEITAEFNTIIITGPNAGGKSVAMKTMGLLSLLAQSGCHIPASSESELRIFSDIFVDMGDDQSIENDLSSFSSHLNNLKLILENANERSLVLLDEIGSGTDPVEGSSIAAAVLESLTKLNSINIATTHHGNLKAFAFETPRMQNATMEFNQTTLQPTYRYRSGVPGSSYAIEMAERLNMSSGIIKRSREIKGGEANKLEDLILDLERKSQELKSTLDKVNEEKSLLNNLNLVYQNKITSLEKEVKDIKARALDEAKHIVRKANSVIEKSIREIKESSADRQIIKKAKDEIKQVGNEFTHLLEEITTAPELKDFKVGDKVHLKQSNTVGEIISKLENDFYIVLTGNIRLKVDQKELLKATDKEKLSVVPIQSKSIEANIKRELDLRGMYGDEAISEVDKFIDTALISGIHRIDIIHGKGTGALRKKITEYLKSNSSVKSFRLGEWNEGGSGVTVVELK
ncbi:MAG: endonuclease MutS2 [Bacteroidota bacterium]|nr:endonuclease MutS2 [Bacteroidota bacterium]